MSLNQFWLQDGLMTDASGCQVVERLLQHWKIGKLIDVVGVVQQIWLLLLYDLCSVVVQQSCETL